MKTCKSCEQRKSLSEFYNHPRGRDGKFEKCKVCILENRKVYRANNPEALRLYEKSRLSRKTENRRAYRLENPLVKKYPKGPSKEMNRLYQKRWREKNPEKTAAHGALNRAVKNGEIQKQPCVMCGSKDSEAHHPDYAMPLDVIWLCPSHHKQVHSGEISLS